MTTSKVFVRLCSLSYLRNKSFHIKEESKGSNGECGECIETGGGCTSLLGGSCILQGGD